MSSIESSEITVLGIPSIKCVCVCEVCVSARDLDAHVHGSEFWLVSVGTLRAWRDRRGD